MRDPREAELIHSTASVLVRLTVAVERDDYREIWAEIGHLLSEVYRYNDAMRERPSDEPLRAAVARLDAGWRQP